MQVRKLQCTCQSNDKGDVIIAQTALSFDGYVFGGILVCERGLGDGAGGDATCHWSIVVDVELEEVEHGV